MLTEAGNRYVLDAGCARLYAELIAHGGPWAVPLDIDGYEVTDVGTGMFRKQVEWPAENQMYARWTATAADDNRSLSRIGLAADLPGPILVTIAGVRPHVCEGDPVSLLGPLEFRVG